jgi:hypothetical protein
MTIKIAQRYKPFSHRPGTAALLPGSSLVVRAYPTRLEIFSLSGELLVERSWPLEGPVAEFTVEQDLEKGHLRVWGSAENGYYRYRLHATEDGVQLVSEKGQISSEIVLGMSTTCYSLPPLERISFGDHHKQEWEGVKRRFTLSEFLPFWFHLGQQLPEKQGDLPNLSANQLPALFLSRFQGLLVPTFKDYNYEGIDFQVDEDLCPLLLLTEGSRLIRSLLLMGSSETFSLLSGLPQQLHAGRAVGMHMEWGSLDMEWRSRRLRRVILRATEKCSLQLTVPKEIKRFRCRGRFIAAGQKIELMKGEEVECDRFER